MSDATPQNMTSELERQPVPPPEGRAQEHAPLNTGVRVGFLPHTANDNAPKTANDNTVEAGAAEKKGNWFHENRWFTKEPLSYAVYQFFRATVASFPYMFGMSAGQHLFTGMSAVGQKIGLTKDGIEIFTNAVEAKKSGLAAVEAAAVEEAAKSLKHALDANPNIGKIERMAAESLGKAKIFEHGFFQQVGRGLMRFGNSPMNPAVQIALGFTLFRFTGGLVKNLRDRVMNEKNTAEETNFETKNWWNTLKETARVNWPAESTSTPIAALVLGYIGATFTPTIQSIAKRDTVLYPGFKGFCAQARELWSPKAKRLQHAGVWTIGYTLFFLLAEELFKDVQLRRGLWKGHPNSLKNGPDDTVGGPGAVDYIPPENDPAHEKAAVLFGSAEEGYAKKEDDRARDSKEQLRFPLLTGEPSIGRFLIRRLAPVAVGISAYAMLKPLGYLAAGGVMNQITVPKWNELAVRNNPLKTVWNHTKFFAENGKREFIATTMFGALWWATDAWGSFYDKFVHNLQKPENAVPLNDNQQKNHAELLAKLNEKERASGRAA